MNMRFISDSEIQQRHEDVRNGAHRARHSFTVSGVCQLFGNTFIALGMRMYSLGEKRREAPIVKPTAMPAHSL